MTLRETVARAIWENMDDEEHEEWIDVINGHPAVLESWMATADAAIAAMREAGIGKLWADIWDAAANANSLDGGDIQQICVESGLAQREIFDRTKHGDGPDEYGLEEGEDSLIVLTEMGRAMLAAAPEPPEEG